MSNRLFLLVLFLGALVLGLFWFSGVIENLEKNAYAAGKAECEAEQSKKNVIITNQQKEVENVQERKKAIIWSQANADRTELLRRMHSGQL